MNLAALIQGLPVRQAAGPSAEAVTLADLTDDSRQVGPGALFIARQGVAADGAGFIADAIQRGAAAILAAEDVSPPTDLPDPLAWLTCSSGDAASQALTSRLAERFFGQPSRQLALIGITGTNGKTTTALIAQHLLQTAGMTCGLIGTVLIDDGRDRRVAELTTPGAIQFSRLLAAMVRHGCKAAVAEVSSHALDQGRVAGLDFDVAVFTNLTGDHLDYHGTMDAYAAAKAKLFEQLKPTGWSVINRDDPYAMHVAASRSGRRVMACTLTDATDEPDPDNLCRATVIELQADQSRARLTGPWGSVELRLPLVGRHNVANALQALAAANCITAMARIVRPALENCPPVPGRLEPVRLTGESPTADAAAMPTVLVDYAHTHDALENVLLALRPVTKGRLIVLFGCGGDRDRTKRPKMAAVARRLADAVVITSDNPRREDPQAIIDDILCGMVDGEWRMAEGSSSTPSMENDAGKAVNRANALDSTPNVPPASSIRHSPLVLVDRTEAIRAAVMQAEPGDTVLLAGKGHEDYQIVSDGRGGTVKRPFDDRRHAAEALREWLRQREPAYRRSG